MVTKLSIHRLGRLSWLLVLAVVWLLVADGQQPTTPNVIPSERCKYADIGFLVDTSGSVGEELELELKLEPELELYKTWPLTKQFIERIIGRLDLGPNQNLVAMVQFSSTAEVVFNFTDNSNKSKGDMYQMIDNLRKLGKNTNTALGLRKLRTVIFNVANGDRPSVPNTAIVLTDGQSNTDVSNVTTEAALLKNISTVHVVGVTNHIDLKKLEAIATNSSFVITAENYTELASYVDKLIGNICIPDDTKSQCDSLIAEICFILDDSSSIMNRSKEAWQRDVLNFVSAVIRQFTISEDRVRVAIVKFGDSAKVEIGLNQYSNLSTLLPAVRAIQIEGGDTNIASGLKLAQSIFNTSRQYASRVVVLLTGRAPNLEVENTTLEATRLKQDSGAQIFTVGILPDIDQSLLNSTASYPTPEYNYVVPDCPYLDAIVNPISKHICNTSGSSTTNTPSSTTSMAATSTSSSTPRPTTSMATTSTSSSTPRPTTSMANKSTSLAMRQVMPTYLGYFTIMYLFVSLHTQNMIMGYTPTFN